MIEHIFNEALQLRQRKWHDYKGSFATLFKKHGWYYVIPRLEEKFTRAENITTGGESDTVGESIRDTLLDLAITCLNTINELDENPQHDYGKWLSSAGARAAYNDFHSCDTCKYEDLDSDMYPCNGCYHAGCHGNSLPNLWKSCED